MEEGEASGVEPDDKVGVRLIANMVRSGISNVPG